MCEKCTYSECPYPNAGKYGPEKLRIRTLFTQWKNPQKTLDSFAFTKETAGEKFIFLWNVHEGCSLYLLLFAHKRRYADQKTVFIHQYFIQRNYYEWVWFWKDYWLEFSWHSINLLLFLDQQDIFIFIRIIIYDLQT